MSITTYAELQTAVANWLARSDLTTYVPDFITLAEAGFNRDIRHRRMVTTTTLSTAASTATVALPADFLEARNLVLATSPKVTLDFVTAGQLSQNFPDNSDTGRPSQYTITGTDIVLGKIPDAVYSLSLEYYQKIDNLGGAVTTNWLLDNAPDVYLYGALLQAAPFIQDDERIAVWASFLTRAMEGLGLENERSMWSSGPLTAKVAVTVG